ncbi:histone-lysine N-methyltransferase SMYD3-like [Dermatophagoides pteronyssinus]|uniref:histone-lysine N-methyltransferase SMYD3-like n=1 Tax=Dermatophagoides pteronyssinus TaxID=6956 RepID=UPI003F662A47
MFSRRDYQVGEIISVSLPFVHVLNKEFKFKNCDYCFVECKNDDLEKCSDCEKMYYCGKDCQQKDWIQHKLECKFYKENFNQMDDIYFRFVLRLYLYLKDNPERLHERFKLLSDENSSVSFRCICLQQFLFKDETVISFESFYKQFQLLKKEWDQAKLGSDYAICNEYGLHIFNYKMQRLGIGLYIAESQLKHYCLSNTKILYNGTQLVMRATKPIKTGEQITVKNRAYPPITIPEDSNRVSIMNFNFSHMCICLSCASQNDIHLMLIFLGLCREMPFAYHSYEWREMYIIHKKITSILNEVYSECDLPQILQKIIMLQTYVMLYNGNEKSSVAELAKKLEINLPSVYNEIFENIYFDREEEPYVTVVKALANVEFNVKN